MQVRIVACLGAHPAYHSPASSISRQGIAQSLQVLATGEGALASNQELPVAASGGQFSALPMSSRGEKGARHEKMTKQEPSWVVDILVIQTKCNPGSGGTVERPILLEALCRLAKVRVREARGLKETSLIIQSSNSCLGPASAGHIRTWSIWRVTLEQRQPCRGV